MGVEVDVKVTEVKNQEAGSLNLEEMKTMTITPFGMVLKKNGMNHKKTGSQKMIGGVQTGTKMKKMGILKKVSAYGGFLQPRPSMIYACSGSCTLMLKSRRFLALKQGVACSGSSFCSLAMQRYNWWWCQGWQPLFKTQGKIELPPSSSQTAIA